MKSDACAPKHSFGRVGCTVSGVSTSRNRIVSSSPSSNRTVNVSPSATRTTTPHSASAGALSKSETSAGVGEDAPEFVSSDSVLSVGVGEEARVLVGAGADVAADGDVCTSSAALPLPAEREANHHADQYERQDHYDISQQNREPSHPSKPWRITTYLLC